jgi:hypothetical protein
MRVYYMCYAHRDTEGKRGAPASSLPCVAFGATTVCASSGTAAQLARAATHAAAGHPMPPPATGAARAAAARTGSCAPAFSRMRHSGALPRSDSSAEGTRHAHKQLRLRKA